MSQRPLATIAIAALAIGGCARQLPPLATAADAQRSGIALEELSAGRELVIRKCGGSCHQPPLPSTHRAPEWPRLLDEMAARSNVDREQRRLILQYLVAMSAR